MMERMRIASKFVRELLRSPNSHITNMRSSYFHYVEIFFFFLLRYYTISNVIIISLKFYKKYSLKYWEVQSYNISTHVSNIMRFRKMYGSTFHILGILGLNGHMGQGAAICESRVFKPISTKRDLFLRRTRLNALVTPRRKNDWAAATELPSFNRIRKPVGETSVCRAIYSRYNHRYVWRMHACITRVTRVRTRACVTVRRGRQTRWTNLSNTAVLRDTHVEHRLQFAAILPLSAWKPDIHSESSLFLSTMQTSCN